MLTLKILKDTMKSIVSRTVYIYPSIHVPIVAKIDRDRETSGPQTYPVTTERLEANASKHICACHIFPNRDDRIRLAHHRGLDRDNPV